MYSQSSATKSFSSSQRSQSADELQFMRQQLFKMKAIRILRSFFLILTKNETYTFNLMKTLNQIHEQSNLGEVNVSKTNDGSKQLVQKAMIPFKKSLNLQIPLNIVKSIQIIQLVFNKKIQNDKVTGFYELVNYVPQNSKFISLRERLNKQLVEIFRLKITIATNNSQKYRKCLIHQIFSQIKQFSCKKKQKIIKIRMDQEKRRVEESYLKKLEGLMRVESFLNKKQLRWKACCLRKLDKSNQIFSSNTETQIKSSRQTMQQSQNPQLSIYVSSIKSIYQITSVNKFQQKSKLKLSSQKKMFSIECLQRYLSRKLLTLMRSSLYDLFGSIEYQASKDKLQVLEKQVIALKEDLEQPE